VRPIPGAELVSVQALSDTSVWAAGSRGPKYARRPLVEHWDGRDWRALRPLPLAAAEQRGSFDDIAVVSDNDLWASAGNLLAHWNGSGWTITTARFAVDSLVALGSDDVWALGTLSVGPQDNERELLFSEHWNGSRWRSVKMPATSGELPVYVGLSDAVAISPADIWGVGFIDCGLSDCADPITVHWDSRRWRPVRAQFGCDEQYLYGAAAVSTNDVWAVGLCASEVGGSSDQLIEHWNGRGWRTVPGAKLSADSILRRVDATSAQDVWAVGDTGVGVRTRALLERWNGSRWQVVSAPRMKTLNDVAALSSLDMWAVGGAMIAHYG
jgi:hypothetical protein